MITQRIAAVFLAVLLAAGAGGTAPALAQGASQSPPSPNASNNAPQSPNSMPSRARTLPPGTTGTQRTGTIGTTRTQPAPVRPSSDPATQPASR